ncbi:hypothetical protein HDE_14110 [Halotydeus destructor]|nr:hypothetical protein HDE_14110 [Halotydeus destructor]
MAPVLDLLLVLSAILAVGHCDDGIFSSTAGNIVAGVLSIAVVICFCLWCCREKDEELVIVHRPPVNSVNHDGLTSSYHRQAQSNSETEPGSTPGPGHGTHSEYGRLHPQTRPPSSYGSHVTIDPS